MPKLTLTFDNGPEPTWTNHVLDVLAKHHIKASFFIIGKKLLASKEARACVERAKAEGHWIGNHSFNHVYSLGDIDRADAFDIEVVRTFKELGDLAHPDLLFRPFCNAGVVNERVFKRIDINRVVEAGYSCILFNSIPRDWEGGDWKTRALEDIRKRDWSTMVLHDITGWPDGFDGRPMLQIEEFIVAAKDAGYEFVQEYSPDCLLVAKGKMLVDMSHLAH